MYTYSIENTSDLALKFFMYYYDINCVTILYTFAWFKSTLQRRIAEKKILIKYCCSSSYLVVMLLEILFSCVLS